MNPDTNRFEKLQEMVAATESKLLRETFGKVLRPDGSEVPSHWATFQLGELVVIKDYTFRVAYIGETAILFEPVCAVKDLVINP